MLVLHRYNAKKARATYKLGPFPLFSIKHGRFPKGVFLANYNPLVSAQHAYDMDDPSLEALIG